MKQVKAVLALSLAACSSWQVQTTAAPETRSQGKPRTVRLYLKSGERVELYDATLMADSVVGFARSATSRTRQRVAIATSDVTRVEFRKLHTAATVVAIGVMVVAVVAIVGVASALSDPLGTESDCQPSSYSRPLRAEMTSR